MTSAMAASLDFHPSAAAAASASSLSRNSLDSAVTSSWKGLHISRTRSAAQRRRVSLSEPSMSRRMYSTGLSSNSSSSVSRRIRFGTTILSMMVCSVPGSLKTSSCIFLPTTLDRNLMAVVTRRSYLGAVLSVVSIVHTCWMNAWKYGSKSSSHFSANRFTTSITAVCSISCGPGSSVSVSSTSSGLFHSRYLRNSPMSVSSCSTNRSHTSIHVRL
mmetsp:Transcript_22084/g.77410  ORF Transcript_22084/g.77410 Transcript_22084/m.77410 type:complete len:216 (+) Transcript_22084:1792-2439(+)